MASFKTSVNINKHRNVFLTVKQIFAIILKTCFNNILFAFALLRYSLGGLRPKETTS